MEVSAMIMETDRSETDPLSTRASLPDENVSLDFLVNALNRAVVRKWAAKTEETEYRT
jgi:hypothetical protein